MSDSVDKKDPDTKDSPKDDKKKSAKKNSDDLAKAAKQSSFFLNVTNESIAVNTTFGIIIKISLIFSSYVAASIASNFMQSSYIENVIDGKSDENSLKCLRLERSLFL